jgi:UV DNA damage endonuclease
MLDLFGTEPSYDYPINLHMSAYKGDRADIVKRFEDSYSKLSPSAQRRLVIENEDKPNTWSVKELIEEFFPKTRIPITFDILHHQLNSKDLPEETAFKYCYSTWETHIPLFHYSEGVDNSRTHADLPTSVPNTYGLVVDMDIELKAKEVAVQKFMELQQIKK